MISCSVSVTLNFTVIFIQALHFPCHLLGSEIQVINIIRKGNEAEILKKLGATIVLNSSEGDFDQQLRDACHQHEARLAFDAVAGRLTLQLLEALPTGSKVTVYSCLSYENPQTSADQLIFENKSVDGFWLGPWINEKNLIQILMMWRRAQKLIATDLKTDVRARYPFEDAKVAVQEYLDQMTGGKILLIPN